MKKKTNTDKPDQAVKPSVSIIIPAYNEETLIEQSLKSISEYCRSHKERYDFELLVVNDGSKDRTGEIADKLAGENGLIRVVHHSVNKNLGRALQTGFRCARGEVFVVIDLDLSYSVDHIGSLIEKQLETEADIVVASPYMKAGRVSNVPFFRALFSRVVNRLMRFAAPGSYSTFTGMVRAYKSDFIKNLNLKTTDYEVNPEILYKAMILRAKIVEIPAHLDWSFQKKNSKDRKSGLNIRRGFLSGLMAAFIFRPYIYYFLIGLVLFLIALYIITWLFVHIFQAMPTIEVDPIFIDDRFSIATGEVFRQRPHAFIVGGFTLLVSIQFISLGLLSLQNKRYYEELFHINSSMLKSFKSIKSDTDSPESRD